MLAAIYNSTNGVGNKDHHSAHPQLLHLPQGQELQNAQEDSHHLDEVSGVDWE